MKKLWKYRLLRYYYFYPKSESLSGCAFKIDKTRMNLASLRRELNNVVLSTQGRLNLRTETLKMGIFKNIMLLNWSFQSNDALEQAIAVARQNDVALKIIPGDIT